MAYSRVLQARKNLKDKNGINQERVPLNSLHFFLKDHLLGTGNSK